MNIKWVIEELTYITECLRHYDRITRLPTCNDCGKVKACEYRPGWGEHVRINCPLWEKEETNENKSDVVD